jgi:hypothetical protein
MYCDAFPGHKRHTTAIPKPQTWKADTKWSSYLRIIAMMCVCFCISADCLVGHHQPRKRRFTGFLHFVTNSYKIPSTRTTLLFHSPSTQLSQQQLHQEEAVRLVELHLLRR